MLRYLLRRLGLLLLTVVMASVLIFALTSVLPGNVGRIVLGPFASAQAVASLNHQLGLDQPVLVRYGVWLWGIVHGDWGKSLALEVPILPLVTIRLLRSLGLALFSLVLLVPAALAAGVIAARRQGGLFDRLVSVVGLAIGAIPEFVTGVFLIFIFGLWLRVLPVQALPQGHPGLADYLWHLLLPAVTLTLLLFAYLFRMTRAGMIEALAADYTRTAVLKGLPERVVVWQHVLRNGVLPTITVIGAQLGWMVGGLVVVETLFQYPGIGSLIEYAAVNRDIPLLTGCSLVITVIFACSNLIADLVYAALNPRVRHALGGHG